MCIYFRLYAGPTVVGYGLEGALKFGFYETFKGLFKTLTPSKVVNLLMASVVAGAIASIVLVSGFNPLAYSRDSIRDGPVSKALYLPYLTCYVTSFLPFIRRSLFKYVFVADLDYAHIFHPWHFQHSNCQIEVTSSISPVG